MKRVIAEENPLLLSGDPTNPGQARLREPRRGRRTDLKFIAVPFTNGANPEDAAETDFARHWQAARRWPAFPGGLARRITNTSRIM